jgi:hypothetical protein
MIIDFHTHTFPEKIAERTLMKLALSSCNRAHTHGTSQALTESMRKAGIDYSVIMPVATKPEQCTTINRVAAEINKTTSKTGLLSFGAIHPDNENYRQIIHDLSTNGFRGIKLHPVFQGVYFDDIRYLRIIDCACEHNLIILTHAGYDISYPGQDYVTPAHILPVIEKLHPTNLVLAHTGGWNCWDDVEHYLCSSDVYFDTSFTTNELVTPDACGVSTETKKQLSLDQFTRIIHKHGPDKILFGSDSPWSSQSDSLHQLRSCNLTTEDLRKIEGENARSLLNL